MYNPKDVLTESGYQEYLAHIHNIRNGLFFIINHADDLHIGALEDKTTDILYAAQGLFDGNTLINGDGEKDE